MVTFVPSVQEIVLLPSVLLATEHDEPLVPSFPLVPLIPLVPSFPLVPLIPLVPSFPSVPHAAAPSEKNTPTASSDAFIFIRLSPMQDVAFRHENIDDLAVQVETWRRTWGQLELAEIGFDDCRRVCLAPTVVHTQGMTPLTDQDREISTATRPSRQPPEPIVDAVDVARALRVHPRTVQRWILTGKLRGHRKGNVRSRWRVSLGDCERAYWQADSRKDRRMLEAMIRAGLRATPSLVQRLTQPTE